MELNVDFRLIDVSLELHALEGHFNLIEKQLEELKEREQVAFTGRCKKENLTPDDPEWDLARQERDHNIEFIYPRIFLGPFIVSLYAVYETSVIEIANLIQKKQNREIGIKWRFYAPFSRFAPLAHRSGTAQTPLTHCSNSA